MNPVFRFLLNLPLLSTILPHPETKVLCEIVRIPVDFQNCGTRVLCPTRNMYEVCTYAYDVDRSNTRKERLQQNIESAKHKPPLLSPPSPPLTFSSPKDKPRQPSNVVQCAARAPSRLSDLPLCALRTLYADTLGQMSTVEEAVEEDDDGGVLEAEQQQPPTRLSATRKTAAAKAAAAAAAAGGGGTVSAVSASSSSSAGGRSDSGGGPAGPEKGRRATAGDVRPVSPKRAVAVVRRQSVSKVSGPVWR